MYEYEYVADGTHPEVATSTAGRVPEYRISRVELEQRGRVRSLRRSLLVLFGLLLLQQPLRQVAEGDWKSAYAVDAEVPARLSLLVDLAMISAYWLVGYRALELMWAWRAPLRVRILGYVAAGALVLGGIADLIENAVLWIKFNGAKARVDLSVWWSTPMFWMVVISLVVLIAIALVGARKLPQRNDPSPAPPDQSRPTQAICCSGGGVRSSSFCLGGLQELTARGIYQQTDVVIGVSGGGYMAAGFHSVRWEPDAPHESESWAKLDPPAFSSSSPELHWLRRNSRYLLDSTRSAMQGLLSLLFGVAVNLVLITAILGSTAWFLGWYLVASNGLEGWRTPVAVSLDFGDDWIWVPYVAVIPAAGVLVFVVEKIADKFLVSSFDTQRFIRPISTWLIIFGTILVALLLGVPALLAWLHNFATGSGSVWAQLLHSLGFAPSSVCVGQLSDGVAACGVSLKDLEEQSAGQAVPGVTDSAVVLASGFGAVLAAVLAVVRVAGGILQKDEKESVGSGGLSGLTAKIWPPVKKIIIPWLAAVVVVVVLTTLLLKWTAALVAAPGELDSWHLALWFGAALLGIRLLTDANRTSLHHFYRERLAYAFIVRRSSGSLGPVPYTEPIRFSKSRPRAGAGPRFVSCAVANVNDPGIVPVGRGCAPFAFADDKIGLTDGRLPSGAALTPSHLFEYAADRRFRDATIPAAIAMSGAAFSPLAGRENARLSPFRLVLALANARLGVWLPNPLWINDLATMRRLVKTRNRCETGIAWSRMSQEEQEALTADYLNANDQAWLDGFLAGVSPAEGRAIRARVRLYKIANALVSAQSKPGPFRLMKEAVGRTSLLDRRLYVTDGGHYDNLGLVEALRRRARVIYVLDASSDPEDTFRALGQAIATARMDLDCEVDFDPRTMRRLEAERSTAAWGIGSYRFSDGTEGVIRMVKVIMVQGLPWDVESYSGQNPQFPRTSTGNQFYDEFDLEAYRILGREVTRKLIASS